MQYHWRFTRDIYKS